MKKKVVSNTIASFTTSSNMMRYAMVVALVVLAGFAIMYIYNIQRASKEAFDNNVSASGASASSSGSNKMYQVVYIYSNSCGYCTQFTPTFNSFAKQHMADANLQVLSYEKSMPDAAPYMGYVSAFPTVLVLSKGNLLNSQTGNASLSALQAFVSSSTAAS
jgi:hypothetical protein